MKIEGGRYLVRGEGVSRAGRSSVLEDAALDQAEDDRILQGCRDLAREGPVRLGFIRDQALAAVPVGRKPKGNLALLLRQTLYSNQLHTGLISQGGA
ncbi:hypothetical protein [Brevundimonas diminuta]|uniref:hypothetical protein n=1 Tax=Brevundimonas diminuta TaxID=293 RepID=UPI003F7D7CD3